MNQFKFLVSNKSHSAYASFISETAKENHYLSYRSVSDIKQSLKNKQFILIFNDKKLIGWMGWKNLTKDWVNLSSLFIKLQVRGNKLGKNLIKKSVLKNKNKSFLVTTANPVVKNIVTKLGFKQTFFWKLPINVIVKILKIKVFRLGLIHDLPLIKFKWKYFIIDSHELL